MKTYFYTRLVTLCAVILIICAAFFVFSTQKVKFRADSRWVLYSGFSIIRDGDTELGEYLPLLDLYNFFQIEYTNGGYYDYYPIGTTLAATPFAYAFSLFDPPPQELSSSVDEAYYTPHETVAASLVSALTVGVFFLISLSVLPAAGALLATGVFAFGSPMYSTAAGAFWSHTPSVLLLATTLLLFLQGRKHPGIARFILPLLVFSYYTRQTNLIPLALLGTYTLVTFPRYRPAAIVYGAAVAIPFVLYHMHVYNGLSSPYYSFRTYYPFGHIFQADSLVATLVSPNRGLLVYVPFLILFPIGIAIKLREKAWTLLDSAIVAIIGLHWFLVSSYEDWYGGYAYGPRYFTDVLPFLFYFTFPVIQHAFSLTGAKRNVAILVLVILAEASIFIHVRGANALPTLEWNKNPDIDHNVWRVWDFTDPQILRGYKLKD